MSDDHPEPVRRAIDAALARCDRLGIDHEDFYAALVVARQIDGCDTLPGLVEAAFRRLGVREDWA